MKKKTLWILTLAIAMCGITSITAACKDKGGETSHSSSSITSDSVIVGSDEIVETPTHYGVFVVEGEGYKIIPSASVVETNGSLEFTVAFDKNYDTANAVVQANGEAVTPVDGKYILQNVNKDITLSVSGLVRTSYSVLLAATDGVLLTGDSSVKIGENYSFTVNLEEGVTKGEDFAVKVNGEKVNSDTNVYTLSEVKQDLIITVSGVNVPYYAVEGLTGTGYTVSVSAAQIMKGKDFSFAVNVDEAYEKSAAYSVTVNGNSLEEQDGVYTVKNVQADVVIAVNGLSLRQKFTVTYQNCNLTTGTVYVGTLFHLPTPTRPDYLFNGWKDENGEDFVMDYSGDVTVYASWMTDTAVDYVAKYQAIAEEMATRYTDLKAQFKLDYLNIADYAMMTEYNSMYGHFTDYEKSVYTNNDEVVKAFLAQAEYIPYEELSDAVTDLSVIYEDKAGQPVSYSGYHGSTSVAMGKQFDGAFYSLQSPNADDPCLTYHFSMKKMNFKQLCASFGRVSFFMNGNYASMSLQCGDTLLAYTMESGFLYRIDIQDGYVYVNGDCRMKLSDSVYNGEEGLVFTVVRLPSARTVVNGVPMFAGHYYAQWDISNVYGAKRMEGYSTVVGENTSVQSVRDNIFSDTNASEAGTPPMELVVNGASKSYTYAYAAWANAVLDNIPLGEYTRLKFFVKVTGNVNIWGANGNDLGIYYDKLANWTEIKLVKNGSGYDLYVNGTKSTRVNNLTNLNALAFNGAEGGTITYTNLIAEL